jgi:hypothetical protein
VSTTPLSSLEIWNVLLDQAREDDAFEAVVAATDALSDEQVADELRLAGFQMAEVQRAALAPLAELGLLPPASEPAMQPVQAVAQVVPLPSIDRSKRRRPAVLWLAAAATTATVGGGVLYATLHAPSQPSPIVPEPTVAPPPSTSAPVVPPPPDLVAARDLRARASDALAIGDAAQCLELLDQAKTIDPAGDEAADVAALRRRAMSPKGPPNPRLK